MLAELFFADRTGHAPELFVEFVGVGGHVIEYVIRVSACPQAIYT